MTLAIRFGIFHEFTMSRPELVRRAKEYSDRKGVLLGEQLGFGVHGIVFTIKNQTETGRNAIKVHEREADYCRERDVYLRLAEHGVKEVCGCAVPELIECDDDLWIIEMTVVQRPFILDFAGAFLDQAPTFSEEVMAEWHAEKAEQFGGRWAEVQVILRFLENLGIFLVDVNSNNVSWGQ